MADLAHRNSAGHSLEKNDTTTSDSLQQPLINAYRGDVIEFDRASLMSEDATLENDPVIGDVNLMRAPAPHSSERYEYEGSRQYQSAEHLVVMDDANVLRSKN